MFNGGIVTVFVTDMDRSVRFYTEQLGLKLETKKRSMPVLVIDHVEEKPTD